MAYDLGSDIDHAQRRTAMTLLLKTVHEKAAQEELSTELREGLKETPVRAAKAWAHWLGGYDIDPADFMTCFKDGAEGYDEIILLKDIPFYSHCEHHLAPIIGRATVGYIPGVKGIIGLSKISRIVDAYARRLQVQERLTSDIALLLINGLAAKGVGVQIRARHLCMESRGICQQGHSTTTQALLGVFRDEPEARAEFISLAKSDTPL